MSLRRRAAIVLGALALVAALLALRPLVSPAPLARLERIADGWSGSWWFPRGGPYILGFEAPGPAELAIDGRVVVAGAGVLHARVVFPAGARGVTFRAPAGARLLWHPPGRRGALEYVPASSLSPDPPSRARFDVPGTSRADGAIALAILAIVGAAAVALARPRIDRRALATAALVFAVALAARAWGLGAFGQTWDEDEYWSSGRNYVTNLLALDARPSSWRWNHEHPPITKYVAGLGALWHDGYEAARLGFAVLGAASCVLAWAVARRLLAPPAALLGALAVALTPHLVGHARIVGHETPSVFAWTLVVLLALRAGEAAGEAGAVRLAGRLAALGVAVGLAVATRFANLLVAPLAGLVVVVAATPGGARATLRGAGLGLVVVPAVAAATLVASWPLLWSAPLARLADAWRVLNQQHLPETYLGALVQRPPWHYFPVYVAATAPAVILLGAILAVARGVVRRERALGVLALWLLVPFGIALSPVRQDGVRYVLPALVPLALLAGAGLEWLARTRRAAAVVAAGLAVYLVVALARVHPYAIDHYGEHVGGPARVARTGSFELGWWGEGLDRAVAYVNAHALPGARVDRLAYPTHVTWFREDLWARLSDRPRPDATWLVVNRPWLQTAGRGFRPPADARLVHQVVVGGAPIAWVYRRDEAE